MATVKGAWGESYEVEDTPIVETPLAETPEVPPVVTPELTPPVVTPETVETPAATIETPAAEVPPIVEPPTAVEIREVEKIVEKYPEMDEFQTNILQYIQEGKLSELGRFIADSQRDYVTMSDYDVVKANLMRSNPNYTDEIAGLKIEMQYGEIAKIDLSKIDNVLDAEAYAEAEDHNATVDRNLKMLKVDAVDARASLESAKKEIKLPIIEKQTPHVETTNSPTPESIAQAKSDWEALVDKELPNVKEFTFNVGNDEIGHEDVSYKVSDVERSEQSTFIKDLDMQKMVARLGWVDGNGKQNIQKMAGDVLKLEKMQQIISSAYTQGHTTGTKGTIVEIKNIDLNGNVQTSVAETPPDIGLQVWGHLNPK